MRFEHIGYAVKDLRRYLDTFLIPMFSPVRVTEPITDPIQQVTVCFVELAGGPIIELVEPRGERSPVQSIVGSNRGGLYHVCYEVDSLEGELERFRGKGCLPLGRPVPATAFNGRRIVFLLTPERDLIELVEREVPDGRGEAAKSAEWVARSGRLPPRSCDDTPTRVAGPLQPRPDEVSVDEAPG